MMYTVIRNWLFIHFTIRNTNILTCIYPHNEPSLTVTRQLGIIHKLILFLSLCSKWQAWKQWKHNLQNVQFAPCSQRFFCLKVNEIRTTQSLFRSLHYPVPGRSKLVLALIKIYIDTAIHLCLLSSFCEAILLALTKLRIDYKCTGNTRVQKHFSLYTASLHLNLNRSFSVLLECPALLTYTNSDVACFTSIVISPVLVSSTTTAGKIPHIFWCWFGTAMLGRISLLSNLVAQRDFIALLPSVLSTAYYVGSSENPAICLV